MIIVELKLWFLLWAFAFSLFDYSPLIQPRLPILCSASLERPVISTVLVVRPEVAVVALLASSRRKAT